MNKSDKNMIKRRYFKNAIKLESFLSCSPLISSTYLLQTNNHEFARALFSSSYDDAYRAQAKNKDRFSTVFIGNDGISSSISDSPTHLIGIDPGLSGAIAILNISITHKPTLKAVYDIPTYSLKVAGKNRKRIDLTGLASIIDLYSDAKLALIEDVSSMPTDGHVGAFSFGFVTGALHGALAIAGIKIEKIKPAVWKASLGLDADKAQSIKLALKLFPEAQTYLNRKKDDGRAEAILLAWFAYKNMRKA